MTCLFGRRCNALGQCVDAPTTRGCEDPGCYSCGLGDFVSRKPFVLDSSGKPVVEPHHTTGHLIEGFGWVIDEQAGTDQIPFGCVIVKVDGKDVETWLLLHAFEHTQASLPESVEVVYWSQGAKDLESVTLTRS